MNIGYHVILPVKRNQVDDCIAIREDGELALMNCPVQTFLVRIGRAYGQSISCQRKMFQGKRGTIAWFGSGIKNYFLQVKLAQEAPALGYVNLGTIREIFVDVDGKCTIRFEGDMTVHTYWGLETLDGHIRNVNFILPEPVVLPLSHPSKEEMERLALIRQERLRQAG